MAKSERQSAFTGNRSRTVEKMLESVEAQTEPQTSGQGKPGHAGKLGQDKRGVSKATYNLPTAAQAMVREMAAAYDVPMNDIVEAAIVLLGNAQAADPNLLTSLRVPARLLTARYRLNVPTDFYFSLPASQP